MREGTGASACKPLAGTDTQTTTLTNKTSIKIFYYKN